MPDKEKAVKSADELAKERTNLAYERTALANDRTLMAWVRTATSLISFGFTIYKFFEDMAEIDRTKSLHKILTSREVGMILIAFGFLGLLFALIQYHSDMKRLRSEVPSLRARTFTPYLAMLMLIFSLLLFAAAMFRQ